MAGTVRKRTRTNRQGEAKTTWFADYYDQQGQRHRRFFPTKRAAESWLTDTRTEVKAGIHTPDAESITVKEAAAMWLDQGARDQLSRGTLRVYDQYVRIYLNPRLGALRLSRLTTPRIVAFRDALLDDQVSPYRTRKVISTLRLVLAEMRRRGLVAQNAAEPVGVKISTRDAQTLKIGVDVPSKSEVQAMLQHPDQRCRTRLAVSALTGIRAGELRALLWEDIDLEERILHVRRGADWWGTIGPTKSKNGARDIPMTPYVVNTLRAWKLACPPAAPGRLDLVFPGRADKVVSHSTVQSDFDQVQRQAGILDADGAPKYGLHALRHFFASWGIAQGSRPSGCRRSSGTVQSR
jgi:integrase